MLDNLTTFFNELLADNLVLSFHGFNYIENASLTLIILLILAFLFYSKKINRVATWFFYILPTSCFLILAVSIFFFFLPVTKLNTIIFTAIFGCISLVVFILQRGWQFPFKEFFTKKTATTILRAFLVFNLLAVFYNFSIFMTPLPYSAGVNLDFSAHALLTKKFSTQSYFQQIGNVVGLGSYPMGSHAAMAYLDLILPYAFVTITEYSFIFMAVLAIGILAYARIKKCNLFEIIPFLFIPAFLQLVMFDHVNSAVAMIPTFLMFVFTFEKISKNLLQIKISQWLQMILICMSFFFIYQFSLALVLAACALATVVVAICTPAIRQWMIKHKWKILLGIVLAAISALTVFFYWQTYILNLIAMSTVQGNIDNYNLNILQFLGIFNFSYSYLQKGLELWLVQIGVVIFWLLVLAGRIFNQKELHGRRNIYLSTAVVLLFFFGAVELFFQSDYITIRYYSYAILAIMVFIINTHSIWRQRKFYQSTLTILAILISFGFVKMQLENQIDRRANASNGVKINYTDAILIENELTSNSKVAVVHDTEFSIILQMFLFPIFGDNMARYYHPATIADVVLAEFDYVITRYKQTESYPSTLLELVSSDQDMNYAVFKVLTKESNLINTDLNLSQNSI